MVKEGVEGESSGEGDYKGWLKMELAQLFPGGVLAGNNMVIKFSKNV
jgi:hypothetical protein